MGRTCVLEALALSLSSIEKNDKNVYFIYLHPNVNITKARVFWFFKSLSVLDQKPQESLSWFGGRRGF